MFHGADPQRRGPSRPPVGRRRRRRRGGAGGERERKREGGGGATSGEGSVQKEYDIYISRKQNIV